MIKITNFLICYLQGFGERGSKWEATFSKTIQMYSSIQVMLILNYYQVLLNDQLDLNSAWVTENCFFKQMRKITVKRTHAMRLNNKYTAKNQLKQQGAKDRFLSHGNFWRRQKAQNIIQQLQAIGHHSEAIFQFWFSI